MNKQMYTQQNYRSQWSDTGYWSPSSIITMAWSLTSFFLVKKIFYFLAVLGLRCGTRALSSHDKSGLLSSCDVRAPLHWLFLVQPVGSRARTSAVAAHGVWNLPRLGIEPLPPALTGGSLNMEPPGKSVITDVLKTTGLMSPWPHMVLVDAL